MLPARISDLPQTLADERLVILGHTSQDDGTILLIGPQEPAFWPHFTASAEYQDGTADPLDRWSTRVLTPIAANIDADAIFPFGGAPFHPFFTWAQNSGRFFASPINFLVHDTAGLFASFRGAIKIPEIIGARVVHAPCTACAAPCATACPVDAFANGYDVAACKTHINSPAGQDCLDQGCRARRACPVGQGNRLPAQAAFHMKAFQ